MDINKKVSMAVIRRIPKYYRYLGELLEKDITRISSRELSRLTGFTASQIRQDLNNFGGFGQQGYGYNVEELRNELGKILGLNKVYKCIIVGAGNLGQAIANYSGFQQKGFKVLALFDTDPELVGRVIRGVEIKDANTLEKYILENKVDIGVICTPKNQSQRIADRFVRSGIKGIWNFAPYDLKVPQEVLVEDVHLSDSLLTLSHLLKEKFDR